MARAATKCAVLTDVRGTFVAYQALNNEQPYYAFVLSADSGVPAATVYFPRYLDQQLMVTAKTGKSLTVNAFCQTKPRSRTRFHFGYLASGS